MGIMGNKLDIDGLISLLNAAKQEHGNIPVAFEDNVESVFVSRNMNVLIEELGPMKFMIIKIDPLWAWDVI